MLRFDLLNNLYSLLNSYKHNRADILSSIISRSLDKDIIRDIDAMIVQLSRINSLLVSTNTMRNKMKRSDLDKDQAVKVREHIKHYTASKKTLEESLLDKVLSLPNIIAGDTPQEDITMLCNSNTCNLNRGIQFNNYISAFTIRNCGRTVLMNHDVALLRKALVNFCIKNNISYGFKLVDLPCIIESEYLYITGHLPKFRHNLFFIDENYVLVPTGEVLLMKYVTETIDIANHNNILVTGNSMCFRNEDTHPGQMNKPLIRTSCFEKTELFAYCKISDRHKVLTLMLECAENILNTLGLKYKRVRLSAKEMSHSAYIQYDIEVFFPQTDKFIEVSSCSDCGQYQLIRCKEIPCDNYVTLNCSSLAIERIIAALIEYYFDPIEKKISLPANIASKLNLIT